MMLFSKTAVFLALVLTLAVITGPASALKHKNRGLPGQRLSLFSPFIVLDEEDQQSLGRAGKEFANKNAIITRNPILLIPGTSAKTVFDLEQRPQKETSFFPDFQSSN